MTNEEARTYFIDSNERIISVAKDENRYNYETQQIEDVFMRRDFEAKELAIKALEQTRWIPVSEQYPIIGQDVLISKGDFVLIDTFCYDSIDETYYFDNYDDVEAWLPLPKPYKEGEKK